MVSPGCTTYAPFDAVAPARTGPGVARGCLPAPPHGRARATRTAPLETPSRMRRRWARPRRRRAITAGWQSLTFGAPRPAVMSGHRRRPEAGESGPDVVDSGRHCGADDRRVSGTSASPARLMACAPTATNVCSASSSSDHEHLFVSRAVRPAPRGDRNGVLGAWAPASTHGARSMTGAWHRGVTATGGPLSAPGPWGTGVCLGCRDRLPLSNWCSGRTPATGAGNRRPKEGSPWPRR